MEVAIQKVRNKATLETGSPVNVVSSKLMKKLKLAPDLAYTQSYGMAGLSTTRAIGAYFALPLRVGKFLLAAPAVVLENKTYDLLIGTQFLREYSGIINLRDRFLLLLSYTMPLVFEEPSKLPGKRLNTCVLLYPSGVFSLKFRMHSSNLRSPPPLCCRQFACIESFDQYTE